MYVKLDPGDGAIFASRGHNLNKLGRCPLGDATYQISRLYLPRGFRKEDLFVFHYIHQRKKCNPTTGPFYYIFFYFIFFFLFFASEAYFEQTW